MKRVLWSVVLLYSILNGAWAQESILQERMSARITEIARERSIPMTVNGTPQVEIVIPADAGKVVRGAASELQKFMKQSLGAEIPVVTAPGAGKTSLILGDQKLTRDAGIDVNALPRDGFVIQAKGRRIFIAGKDSEIRHDPFATRGWGTFFERGTLHGAYDFLERFLGIRFYFPGEIGTVVPKYRDLNLPQMRILERPDYPRRRFLAGNEAAWFPGVNRKEETANWYQMRMETFYVPVCHSLERLKFAERFGAEHPEYIGMDANGKRYLDKSSPYYGNLCLTDPGLREELYKDAEAYLTGKSAASRGLKNWDPSICQPGFFNIMPKDHFRDCECPRCKEFYKKYSTADLVWDLTADIGRRLLKNKIPGYITALAYGHYTDVTKIDLPSNLLMMVSVRGPWAEMTPAKDDFDKRIDGWKEKTGRKPWLWSAVYKYGGLELPNVPPTTPRTVASYFAREKDRISGTFMESETDHWLFSYLNYYFMAKSTWDNALDYNAMFKEHHRLMFGVGAAPMEKFFDRIENIWIHQIAGRIVETPTGSQAVPPTDYELWEKIYSPEQFRQFDAWFAEALKLTKGDAEAEKRVRYFEEHFLGQMKKGAAAYRKTKQGVENWKYNVRTLKPEEKIVLDGNLGESAWTNADGAHLLPFKAESAEVSTVFKIRRDGRYLYFGVQCDEPKTAEVIADCKQRDDPNLWRDSVVELFLNPSGNRKDYLHFIINSNGVFYDASATRVGAGSTSDVKWNSKMEVKTAKNSSGWSLEARIPLADLPDLDTEKMIANIGRHRVIRSKAKVPLYSWSPYIKGFHDLENFGSIRFDSAPEENLLKDGDFSAPLKGRSFGGVWHTGSEDIQSGQILQDHQIFRVGGQSLRIEGKDGKRHLVTQFLPKLKPNTKYLLTFDIRMEQVRPSGTGPSGAVLNMGVPGNLWYPKNWYTGSMPWTSQGWEFTTSAETNRDPKRPAFLRLQLYNAFGIVWFDNLQLKEVK